MARRGHPSVVIDASISEHLKVLCSMPLLSLGIVKGIDQRFPVERSLDRPVHALGKGKVRSFQDRRRNISYVGKLRTNLSFGFNAFRPVNHESVCGPAVMRGDLLGPLERSIARPRPANGVMWKGFGSAPLIQMRHVDLGGVN